MNRKTDDEYRVKSVTGKLPAIRRFLGRLGPVELVGGVSIGAMAIKFSMDIAHHVPLLGITLIAVFSAFFAAFGAGYLMLGILAFLNRTRNFGNGVGMDGVLYRAIASHLKRRGIKDTKGFICDYPQYLNACDGLIDDLGYGYVFLSSEDREHECRIVSLVYLTDNDPEETRTAIVSLIQDRGIRSVESLKALLATRSEIETPLMEGAL